MKPDALNAPHANRGEAEVVLQEPELALDGRAAAVEAAPLVRSTRDAKLPLRLALAERGDGRAVALVALSVDAVVVLTAIHGHRLRPVAASAYHVE